MSPLVSPAIVSPSNVYDSSVTWSSSDSNIATVDKNGKVTAKSVGTTTIKAMTTNGKVGDCEVEVTKEKVIVSRYEKIGDDANGELRVQFTGSGKVWRVVNKDTIYCNDVENPNYPSNFERIRCNYNAYEGYNQNATTTTSNLPMIRYSDDEMRLLFVIDPYGVADYVLKYAEKEANLEKSILDIKDDFFIKIFGKTPQRMAIDNGIWRPATSTDPDTSIYSESETIFGANLTYEEGAEAAFRDFFVTALEIVFGLVISAVFPAGAVKAACILYAMIAIRTTVGDSDFENIVTDWVNANFFEDIKIDWLTNVVDFAVATIKLQDAIELDHPEFSEHAEYINNFDCFEVFIEA